MMRNLVTSLIEHERLETTSAKAKELRLEADKMITLAKKGDLHARRQALAFIRDKDVVHKLFEEIKNRYLDRNGGYTKISKLRYRRGDAAPISVIELVGRMDEDGAAAIFGGQILFREFFFSAAGFGQQNGTQTIFLLEQDAGFFFV